MSQRTETLILPGYGNSGNEHWQSIWESRDRSFNRVLQDDWERPDLHAWTKKLEQTVAVMNQSFLIAAHSLGCLLVAHWAAVSPNVERVKGALLVAVPDPARPAFPESIRGFSQVPARRLPFRSILVASDDDPYATIGFSRRCGESWGSSIVELEKRGHINAASGLGDWEHGLNLLRSLDR